MQGNLSPRGKVVALLAVASIGIAGCGEGGQSAVQPTFSQLKSQLTGAPANLAALHGQMGKVMPTGKDGFERALQSVRGTPAVVNVWAPWCGPCRYEFPVFGEASMKLGKRVAFLGIASRDVPAASQRFLDSHPVGYPSWADSDGSLGRSLGIAAGMPATVIYDRGGRRAFIHQGPYASLADLERDINRYGNAK